MAGASAPPAEPVSTCAERRSAGTSGTIADLRCSTWARSERVDPVSTAGSYLGYLLVEWPLPWPRDVSRVSALSEATDAAAQLGWRTQLLARPDFVGHNHQSANGFRLAAYEWDGTKFSGREKSTDLDSIVADALGLMRSAAGAREIPSDLTEVLICGHGQRDRCCGRYGTLLASDISGGTNEGVQYWRTSHTGGHRFAPTGMVLPSGTLWAYLTKESLAGILNRTADPREAAAHYRGCAGLVSRAQQALERELLAEIGWDLFDQTRSGADLDDGRTRLSVGETIYEGTVHARRRLPVPACGFPISEATKAEEELTVRDLATVT